jgi:flavorubredoxin
MSSHKTHHHYFEELDQHHKHHAHRFEKHFNETIDPDIKAALLRHAENEDHAGMISELEKIAKSLGITVSAIGLVGLGWWAIKRFKST